MKIIYKYIIDHRFIESIVSMPEGAEILTAQAQDDQVCIWVIANPGNVYTERHFSVYGTGRELKEKIKYIGSVQLQHFVWHIFEDLSK